MMDFPLRYPLTLTFKLLALAPQVSVTDSQGRLILYVQQKLFKLRETVTVFADVQKTQPLYTIKADRILDISAQYRFTDQAGALVGAVKRYGLRSLWRAHYDIMDGERVTMSIHEENPWVKVLDAMIGEVPILGFFSGLLFHPAYLVTRADGTVVMRLEKQPAFFERRYKIEELVDIPPSDELKVLLSLLMLVLLERRRG